MNNVLLDFKPILENSNLVPNCICEWLKTGKMKKRRKTF